MRYFITKYALTKGIEEYSDVQLVQYKEYPSMLTGNPSGGLWNLHFHGEGKEWHRTEGDAIKRAEEMRIARIASLKKVIAKLEKMDFKVVKK